MACATINEAEVADQDPGFRRSIGCIIASARSSARETGTKQLTPTARAGGWWGQLDQGKNIVLRTIAKVDHLL
jgi:hypothetical protein